MNLVLGSMFRNSASYLDRYFSQVESLRILGHDLHLVLAEGDSTDNTHDRLRSRISYTDIFIKVDHGGPHYGSVDHPQRWADIARVARAIVQNASELINYADAFIWVESDLIWTFSAMTALLADLKEVPAVAPMVFAGDSTRFYDTYGFRKDGERFNASAPYAVLRDEPTRIDSCGSCFVLAPSMFPELFAWNGHWPIRLSELYVDPLVSIRHP